MNRQDKLNEVFVKASSKTKGCGQSELHRTASQPNENSNSSAPVKSEDAPASNPPFSAEKGVFEPTKEEQSIIRNIIYLKKFKGVEKSILGQLRYSNKQAVEKALKDEERKSDAFLEALNHIVYCGSQKTPIYQTPEMKAKTQMAIIIREIYMLKYGIPKEKIENYVPEDDTEADGVDVDE